MWSCTIKALNIQYVNNRHANKQLVKALNDINKILEYK